MRLKISDRCGRRARAASASADADCARPHASYNRLVPTEAPIELDAEYRQLREEAALVRRPALRVIEVRGADAVDYLESQLTNDIASLVPGGGCYAALLDRKGHLQSDVRVLALDDDRLWLIAEAEGVER